MRSSCETLATKSRRMRSARRRSVMSCSTSTAPRAGCDATGALRATMTVLGLARQRQLEALASPCRAAPRRSARRCRAGARSRGSGGPRRSSCSCSIAPRRGVDELHAALVVDDQHAFDHAGEDRLHARAVGRELGRAAADLARPSRRARAPRCRSRRCRSRAPAATSRRRVALGDLGDRAHAPAEERRRAPGEEQRGDERRRRTATSAIRRTRGELLADLGQRQREPDVRRAPARRVA